MKRRLKNGTSKEKHESKMESTGLEMFIGMLSTMANQKCFKNSAAHHPIPVDWGRSKIRS